MMYALDGEIIETVDDIPNDCNLIIVSTNREKFSGLKNNKDFWSIKDFRINNASEVKHKFSSINKKFVDELYLEWAEQRQGNYGVENIEISLT